MSPDERVVVVERLPIELDAFLKLAGEAATGGQAKLLCREGAVSVNGSPETRRGRKLGAGDTVAVSGRRYRIRGKTPR